MNIYKYNINAENVICITECPVIEDHGRVYVIQETKRRTTLYKTSLEVFSSKILYSTSPDKMQEYVDLIKEHYTRVAEDYILKAEKAKESLKEIILVNKL